MRYLTPEVVHKEIDAAGDRAFYVEFVKRTDNTLRGMIARRHVVPETPSGDSSERVQEDRHNCCLTVYEMTSKTFKRIPLDRVIALHLNGKRITA